MGQFGGPGFAQWCKEAIPRLVQVIQAPDSREQENVNPTENAISAIETIEGDLPRLRKSLVAR